MLHPWAEAVQQQFAAADNPRVAGPMAAYMKHHFPFHGISA
ncbi:MAG: DNA alkylation repair protein [Sphingomonadales bacterium]|nr:DNA alkylation repair protein [Sphingomonadales bacterium]